MNKKLFSWKALAGLTLLVAMGLTSCTTEAVDPTGGNKKPSTEPTDPTASIVVTGDVVDVKALAPSDITAALKQLTGAKTRAANKEYTVNINSASMKVTAADNTITIPEVTDAIWNINFDGAFAGGVLTIEDDALDYVNINLSDEEYPGFALDMPFSTVALSGDAIIDELGVDMDAAGVRAYPKTLTFGERFLNIYDVYVKALDYVNGGIIVNTGAAIDAYIAGNNITGRMNFNETSGNTTTQKVRGQEMVTTDANGLIGAYNGFNAAMGLYNTMNADRSCYYVNNLVVRKYDGTDYDYPVVRVAVAGKTIDQITMEAGSKMYLVSTYDESDNYSLPDGFNRKNYNFANAQFNYINRYHVNQIVGLGNGSATVQVDDNWDAFRSVESVSNVTLDAYLTYPFGNRTIYPDNSADRWDGIEIWTNIEKCTFKNFDYVVFAEEIEGVSNSKFPVADDVRFNVLANGNTTHSFDYSGCEFKADAWLGVNGFITGKVLYDENGDPISYTVWDYAKVNAAGTDWVYETTTLYTFAGVAKGTTTRVDYATEAAKADGTLETIKDITGWDAIANVQINTPAGAILGTQTVYLKNGVYAIKDFTYTDATGATKTSGIKVNPTFFIEWEYNKIIEYNEIPLMARKAGYVNSRTVYAQEQVKEINDVEVTMGFNKCKLGSDAITAKSEVRNINVPFYATEGTTATYDAKVTYKFDIDGTLYRRVYDQIGRHWFFIKAN